MAACIKMVEESLLEDYVEYSLLGYGSKCVKDANYSFKNDMLPDYELVWKGEIRGFGFFDVYYIGKLIDSFSQPKVNLSLREAREVASKYLIDILDSIENSNHLMEYSYER